jgi:hypothetical protein
MLILGVGTVPSWDSGSEEWARAVRLPVADSFRLPNIRHVPRVIIKFIGIRLDSDSNHGTECMH